MSKSEQKLTTYKGFDKDLQCRGMQYRVGEAFETKEAVRCTYKGFHSCENPFDVFNYYPPGTSRYGECEIEGQIDKGNSNDDSKVAASKITVKAELNLAQIIKIGFERIISKVDFKNAKESNSGDCGAASNSGYSGAASNSGDCGAASNSGYSGAASNSGYSGAASNSGYYGAASNSGTRGAASNSGDSGAASNSGDYGAASNSGDYGAASTEGKHSIACGLGYKNKAKGALGCWIVLAERNDDWEIISVKTALVDGKKIKEDTWYELKRGRFIKSE